MRSARAIAAAVALVLVACGSTSTSVDEPGAASEAYPIACTIHRGQSSARIELASDRDGKVSDDSTGVHFEGVLEPIRGAPDDVLFRATVDSKVSHEFRLHRHERPAFQYIGDHGFGGLGYVRVGVSDAQYTCSAGDGPVGGAEPVAAPRPVRARCTVRGPSGDEQTIDIEGAGEKKVDVAGVSVGAFVFDDPSEGRFALFAIGDANVPRTEMFESKQLLQLSRERTLVNLFGAEHGFTGRVSVTLPSGGVVSYACATLDD